MKKTRRLRIWGPDLPPHLAKTGIELAIDMFGWGRQSGDLNAGLTHRARDGDRGDANRMYMWMRRRQNMTAWVRKRLAAEGASQAS